MAYTHLEIATEQSAKNPGDPCGDVVLWERTARHTLVILADGLGHGIRANLAATACASQLAAMLREGFSLREAFSVVAQQMNTARGRNPSYTAFSVAQVSSAGELTVLGYEMPQPIFIAGAPTILEGRSALLDQAVVSEANAHLEAGDGLLLVSDGVTQAGLGQGLRLGWTLEGVLHHLRDLGRQRPEGGYASEVHRRARELWSAARGDDVSAVHLSARPGLEVQVLTGPPADADDDEPLLRRFFAAPGLKVVCGASTAKMVARFVGQPLRVQQQSVSPIAPPAYLIDGVNLVTEGAVTLNQVANLLGDDSDGVDLGDVEPGTGVSRLMEVLRAADRVTFTLGSARNIGQGDIAFRQQGILARGRVVPLLAQQLEARGKLVTVERV